MNNKFASVKMFDAQDMSKEAMEEFYDFFAVDQKHITMHDLLVPYLTDKEENCTFNQWLIDNGAEDLELVIIRVIKPQ